MAAKKSKLNTVTASDPSRDAGPANPPPDIPSRARLGDRTDSWSVVMKDVVREAPKTAIIFAGLVLLTLLSMLASWVAVFAGYGAAAPPFTPPAEHLVSSAFEGVSRIISSGG